MKTDKQVDNARDVVAARIQLPGIHNDQKLLLMGMSVALQWVADAGGETLQRLVDLELMEVGKSAKMAIEQAAEDGKIIPKIAESFR